MTEYEFVTEIFNQCSGNQMRDVFIKEIATDNPRAYVENILKANKVVEINEDRFPDGSVIFDCNADGLRERFSFTPI